MKLLSRVRLPAIPWTVAYQAPLSMEFSRQEYWGGLPFPCAGDLPETGIKPRSPTLQAYALLSYPPGTQHSQMLKKIKNAVSEMSVSNLNFCNVSYYDTDIGLPRRS